MRTRIGLEDVGSGALESEIVVAIADRRLRETVTAAISRAIASPPLDDTRAAVRLRTNRRLEQLGAERIEDAYVVVEIRASNAPRIPKLVAAIRALRPAGVQLVWDGVTPPRDDVERHVFAALEEARATPGGAPVVVAASHEVCFALRILAAERASRARPKEPR